MMASKFSDAQKAFILKQGRTVSRRGDLSLGGDQPGAVLPMDEEIQQTAAVRDEAVEAA